MPRSEKLNLGLGAFLNRLRRVEAPVSEKGTGRKTGIKDRLLGIKRQKEQIEIGQDYIKVSKGKFSIEIGAYGKKIIVDINNPRLTAPADGQDRVMDLRRVQASDANEYYEIPVKNLREIMKVLTAEGLPSGKDRVNVWFAGNMDEVTPFLAFVNLGGGRIRIEYAQDFHENYAARLAVDLDVSATQALYNLLENVVK